MTVRQKRMESSFHCCRSAATAINLGLVLLLSLSGSCQTVHAAVDSLRDVRVLLADGHVVEIDSNGAIADGIPLRLDLGKSSISIHAVAVDLAFDRLYVTPESDYSHRATRVFRLSTLEPLEVLPGITAVVIPKKDGAPTIAAFRSISDLEFPSLTSLQELHENSSTHVELRARSNPDRVIASSAQASIGWGKYECFISPELGFQYFQLGTLVDQALDLKPDTRALADTSADLLVLGCWSDGAVWAVAEREPRDSAPVIGRIVVLDDQLNIRSSMVASGKYSYGQLTTIEFGKASRWLAIIRDDGPGSTTAVGTLFGIGNGSETTLDLPELLSLRARGYFFVEAGLSPDQQNAYLVPTRYLSGGLLRKRLDRVFRLDVDATHPVHELLLPSELTRINLASSLRTDHSLNQTERERRLDLLPPPARQLREVHAVELVHVLPSLAPSARSGTTSSSEE